MTPTSRHSRRLAALALLLLALGLGAFLLLTPRLPAPDAGSTEVTFTREMIAHHTQAILLATLIRQRSTDRTLRSAALDIQLSQEEQIRQMRGFLTLWKQPDTFPMSADHARMMGMASDTEVTSLKTLPLPQAEVSRPLWLRGCGRRCVIWPGRCRSPRAERSAS